MDPPSDAVSRADVQALVAKLCEFVAVLTPPQRTALFQALAGPRDEDANALPGDGASAWRDPHRWAAFLDACFASRPAPGASVRSNTRPPE
jgi:hypothetical protein